VTSHAVSEEDAGFLTISPAANCGLFAGAAGVSSVPGDEHPATRRQAARRSTRPGMKREVLSMILLCPGTF
jgi:hypothetical protein